MRTGRALLPLVMLLMAFAASSAEAAAPEIQWMAPYSSDHRVGDLSVAGPTLMVTENGGPVSLDTFVSITSDAPTNVTVTGGGATVQAGSTTAVVSVSCVGQGSSLLSASLNGAAPKTATVRCIAAGAPLVWLETVTPPVVRTGQPFQTGAHLIASPSIDDPSYHMVVTGPNATTADATGLGANGTGILGYTGAHPGTDLMKICLGADCTGSSGTIEVTWVEPAVGLSTSSLTFPDQVTGGRTAAKTVTVTNTGSAALSFAVITINGPQPDDFSITSNTCSGALLAAGAACTIGVDFGPAATGTREATLSIGDDASGSPHTVSLAGVGTAPPSETQTQTQTVPSLGSSPEPSVPIVAAPPGLPLPRLSVKSKRDKRSGGVVLTITTSGPGAVTATAKWKKGGGASVGKPNLGKLNRVVIILKPPKKAKALLKKQKRLPITITVVFTPSGGGSQASVPRTVLKSFFQTGDRPS